MAKYEVTYTITRTACVDEIIEADSKEEAERIAREYVDGWNTNTNYGHILDYILDLDSNCGWDTEVTDVEIEDINESKEDTMKKFNVGDTINVNTTDVCPICGESDTECNSLSFENGEVRAEMFCPCCDASYDLWLKPTNAVVIDLC